MALGNTRILTFDTGIERIIHGGEAVDRQLPERNAPAPTGEQLRVRLDEMLNAPALDALLRGSVKLRVTDKSLLAPGRYQALLDEAQFELRSRVGGDRNALAKAALLEEERQLRDLLNTLRNILVRA